ncbi:MAG: dihydroorotate dehydrogenase electron transfer subunit [Bacteroidota bacterium]
MVQEFSEVTRVSEVAHRTFSLEFCSPDIARTATPGQFVNIRINRSSSPLLRRPMSVCDVQGEIVKILFNVVGRGTSLLAQTIPGETIDVLGPLGHGFDFTNPPGLAILVAGGLGVAPFPFLARSLSQQEVSIVSFVGARTANQLVLDGLPNVSAATDDGTKGYQGTVVELLRSRLGQSAASRQTVFACGPTAMLRSLQQFVRELNMACQVSVETAMACGIGLCQGCPVELVEGPQKYKLSCKDGPVFDLSKIVI